MIQENQNNFDAAISMISPNIRQLLMNLDERTKKRTYEIRLRANRPVILFGSYSSAFFNDDSTVSMVIKNNTVILTQQELTDTFKRICGYSVHTHQSSIANGYVTMKGGHRVGIAGTAVCDSSGNISSVRDISSVNIRIAREVKNCADELMQRFFKNEANSLIIAGPPSSGKTTMLRDLIRKLSSGITGKCYKISVIDEREEIAAVSGGIPCRDIGFNCDVLNSYPKQAAIMTALKTLSPQIIACDEIGTLDEVEAIRLGVNTGVRFIVTVHASNFSELVSRPQIERLLETYSFDKIVMLGSGKPGKIEQIYDAGELRDEIYRRRCGIYSDDSLGYTSFAAS
ncbi:MAG: stage III sporulation protein AA [Faecalibacterium sp.]|nr:stage III sporulation protein AA [Ruminococcus sp.]MCM1392735.1 stage III sporulation protein AA [Ruminococcus sp.]MCM1485205.1 stage III sporulation protein AA [Faecalibacterium sp.]